MDRLTKEKRSWNMSRVKSKNTKPELFIRSSLFKKGLRFRLHVKQLPGSPDIVFHKYKAVIFVHGCFWHGHNYCKGGEIPKTRSIFWEEKIRENKSRDEITYARLSLRDWRIAIVWVCALKNKRASTDTIDNLYEWILSESNDLELPSIGGEQEET